MNWKDVGAFAGFLLVISLTDIALWYFFGWPENSAAERLTLAAMLSVISAVRDKSNA